MQEINKSKMKGARSYIGYKSIMRFGFSVIIFISYFQSVSAQTTESDWIKKSDFPGGKTENAVGFSVDRKGYVCTGADSILFKKDCWQYDAKQDRWKKMADFPGEARTGAVSFTIGDKVYVGTGLTGTGSLQAGKNDLWEYNSTTDQWTKKADLPDGARNSAVGFSIGGKGYIGLGAATGKLNFCKDLWEYDPTANTWTKKADFPDKGKIETSVFVIDNMAYVLMGRKLLENKVNNKGMWSFNPKTDKWEKKSDFPGTPRMGATAFSLNNKGYILGGFNGAHTLLGDLWEYDAASDKWSQKPDAAFAPRSSAFCFVIGNIVYTGAGRNQNKLTEKNDFWCADVNANDPKNKIDYNAKLLVQNKNKNVPLSEQGVSLVSEEKKIIQTTTTNKNGNFSFKKVDINGKYQVVLDKNEKLPANASVSLTNPNGVSQKLEKNTNGQFGYELSKINLLEEEDPLFNVQYFMSSSDKEITITAHIYYPSGSAELLPEGVTVLDQAVKILHQYPNLLLEISSHTDSNGEDAANMQLSEKRAKNAVDYFIADGIDAKRVNGKGLGETRIVNRCKNGVACSEEEQKINRRTEFKFIKQSN